MKYLLALKLVSSKITHRGTCNRSDNFIIIRRNNIGDCLGTLCCLSIQTRHSEIINRIDDLAKKMCHLIIDNPIQITVVILVFVKIFIQKLFKDINNLDRVVVQGQLKVRRYNISVKTIEKFKFLYKLLDIVPERPLKFLYIVPVVI